MSELIPINPAAFGAPRGYSNGIRVGSDRDTLHVAGQVAFDGDQVIIGPGDFTAQFEQALANFLAVVSEAGGGPEDVASMTMFVTDRQAYLDAVPGLGAVWKRHMGRHYPAMALVAVVALVEADAMVEIQGAAARAPQEDA